MLNYLGTVELETKRLLLRRFVVDDAETMFKNWASDKEVTRYLTWLPHDSVDMTRKIIANWIDEYKYNYSYQWAIMLKKTGELIGSVSLLSLSASETSCELGYCISKDYWGRGITPEASLAVIDYAITNIGFDKVYAYHHVENEASGKVLIKCGMQYQRNIKEKRKDGNGNLVDCKLYMITKEQYNR